MVGEIVLDLVEQFQQLEARCVGVSDAEAPALWCLLADAGVYSVCLCVCVCVCVSGPIQKKIMGGAATGPERS